MFVVEDFVGEADEFGLDGFDDGCCFLGAVGFMIVVDETPRAIELFIHAEIWFDDCLEGGLCERKFTYCLETSFHFGDLGAKEVFPEFSCFGGGEEVVVGNV